MRPVAAAAACLAILIACPSARADRRVFSFTDGYRTQPAHGVELELDTTQALDDLGAAGARSTWQHRAQLEYGITDSTDVALAQVFEQVDLGGARYAAATVRGRHRFAERGEWPVDITLIAELGKSFSRPAYQIEPRVVVERSFHSGLRVAVNVIGRVQIEDAPGGQRAFEVAFVPGWALGASAAIAPTFAAGLETWGWIRAPGSARTIEAWFGPALSWRPSTKLWITGGGGGGLSDAAVDAVVRFIVALSF